MKKSNKGFTLVELIVVLVILAILAAILVPALLGYIDRAKESQDMLKARNMLQATQAVLVDYYGKGKNLPSEDYKTNSNSDFSKAVRKLADDDPYMVIVGVGTKGDGINKKEMYDTPVHTQHTAYFVAYWESKDKAPIFFDGTDWSMDYPWGSQTGSEYNYFMVNGEKVNLSFIFIANKSNKNIWPDLKKAVTDHGHSLGSNENRKK